MANRNAAKNLTEEGRQLGLKRSLDARRSKQAQRRQKVRKMIEAGVSKSEMARRLGVGRDTIQRDCAAIEGEGE